MQSCRHVDTYTHSRIKPRIQPAVGVIQHMRYMYTHVQTPRPAARISVSAAAAAPSSRGWTVSHLQPPRLIALCEVCGADRGWKALVLSLPVTGHVCSVRSCTQWLVDGVTEL